MVYQGASLPYKILTNSPYTQCLGSLNAGRPPEKDEWQSDGRFIKTAGLLARFDPSKAGDLIEYAFAALSRIKWQAPNQWKLGYDLTRLRIYFQPKNKGFLRHIDLDSFDFDCTMPVQGIISKTENLSSIEIPDTPTLLAYFHIIPRGSAPSAGNISRPAWQPACSGKLLKRNGIDTSPVIAAHLKEAISRFQPAQLKNPLKPALLSKKEEGRL